MDILNSRVTHEEIKNALFSINNSKAPGPDGFSSLFFKRAWSIIGNDVCEAVADFFSNGCMLCEINCTIIALVPKVPNPNTMHDYRPISSCNTIYKCISKIIVARIKRCIPYIIFPAQTAFVQEHSIADNTLLFFLFFWIIKNLFPKGQCPTTIKKYKKQVPRETEKWTTPPL